MEQFTDDVDPDWRKRELKRSEKYIFFLPVLETGFGDRLEATVSKVVKNVEHLKSLLIEGSRNLHYKEVDYDALK